MNENKLTCVEGILMVLGNIVHNFLI